MVKSTRTDKDGELEGGAVAEQKPKKAAKEPAAKKVASPLDMIRAAVLKGVDNLEVVKESKAPLPVTSSGSITIDDLIGGTLSDDKTGPKCPGYPRRKITEIFGAESSGKTTAAIQAIAEVQKNGGTAMFIDFEHALDQAYARRVGVSFDNSKLLFYQPETMEQGWKLIHLGIAGGVDIIVVDSVAAMVPESELEKKPGEGPQIGLIARSLSQNLPKVCIWLNSPKYNRNPLGTSLILLNQVRAKINTGGYGGGGGDTDTSTGGNALKFYAYIRLKFTKLRAEKLPAKRKDSMTGKEVSVPYGNLTQVKLVKCKVDGKQGFTSEVFIRFNHGIDNYFSLIEAAVANKVIGKTGAFYKLKDQQFQGRDKLRKYLMDNPSVFQTLRSTVLNLVRAEEHEELTQDDDEVDEDDLLLLTRDEDEFGASAPVEEVEVAAEDA